MLLGISNLFSSWMLFVTATTFTATTTTRIAARSTTAKRLFASSSSLFILPSSTAAAFATTSLSSLFSLPFSGNRRSFFKTLTTATMTTATTTTTTTPGMDVVNGGSDGHTMQLPADTEYKTPPNFKSSLKTVSKEALSQDYHLGMIGNGRTSALIDAHGKMVYLCLPSFDSGTVFASLLDEEKGGSFYVEMVDGRVIGQAYQKDTNILVTKYQGDSGVFEVVDFMPRYSPEGRVDGEREDVGPDVIRKINVLHGQPRIKVHFDPRLSYARGTTEIQRHPLNDNPSHNVIKAVMCDETAVDNGKALYESVYLWSDLNMDAIVNGDEITLDGDKYLYLSYHDKVQVPNLDLVDLMLQRTRAYWMLWSAQTRSLIPFKYHEPVLRSALVLGMLQFGPTGAFLAAATTSLPESIGEERNWDYRFCWLRDASMTVATLYRIGHPGMATSFIDWVLRTVPTKDDSLQIMYGLRGEKILTEKTLHHLSGYQGSSPVRIGNAAYSQKQHDIFGVVLDVIYQDLLLSRRSPEALDRIWTQVRSIARTVAAEWEQPDRGIWEIRGERRHFVFSKVLCWVAIDRAIKIALLLKKTEWADRQRDLLETMHKSIYENGFCEEKGAFTQSYGSKDLDAANLLLAEYGFIDPMDPKFVATVEKTKEELSQDGLLYRYRNQDDFGQPTSAFTVCSFWLVKALASIKRRSEAEELFHALLDAANIHGLYGEDLDFATRRHLGNFPQAYSHLALIDCALELAKHN